LAKLNWIKNLFNSHKRSVQSPGLRRTLCSRTLHPNPPLKLVRIYLDRFAWRPVLTALMGGRHLGWESVARGLTVANGCVFQAIARRTDRDDRPSTGYRYSNSETDDLVVSTIPPRTRVLAGTACPNTKELAGPTPGSCLVLVV